MTDTTNNTMALDKDDYSPMLQQYVSMKEQCGDAILFFRCGDFYEMFMDDAIRAADLLDIALTRKFVGKGQKVPLAGIPFHAAQSYIYRLTRQGCRVAICEQMEQPQKGKKIVHRELVRTISPGTIIDADVIEGKDNNFLAALFDGGLIGWGLACVDVTTGEFRATWESGQDGWKSILAELGTLNPSEILTDSASSTDPELIKQLRTQAECMITGVPLETCNRENFEILMRGNPQIALKLLRLFTKRIYDQRRRFMILTLDDTQAKVADVFLMLNELKPEPEEDTGEREFHTTVEDIAHWAGISPEQSRSVLSHFNSQRRIEIGNDKIVVKNINDFARFVSSRRKT